MKKYIVIDREESRDAVLFICEDTESINNIFWTTAPIKINNAKDLEPMVFEDRSEAVRFKNRLQAQVNVDWADNGHIHRVYGKRKAAFKVEPYIESEFLGQFEEINNP